MYKAVLFDLDGTLANTIHDITDSVNCMLSQKGYPLKSHDDILRVISYGRREFLRRCLPPSVSDNEEELARCLTLYTQYYEQHYMDNTKPYDGMIDLIIRLQARGILSAVVTNKAHKNAVYMIDKLFPKEAFYDVWGLLHFPPKPDPTIALHAATAMGVAPAECLFVGDSELDMITAQNAGMCAVGVSWGYRPVSVLQKNGADFIVNSPAELEQIALGDPFPSDSK